MAHTEGVSAEPIDLPLPALRPAAGPAADARTGARTGAPTGGLTDGFGRTATDLRLSLTDRCTLRCTYCMPADGMQWLPRAEVLADDEIVRLARIGVETLGIRQIRLTGGEPLLRPHLPALVARLAALEPRPGIAMTTNGLRLAEFAVPLKAAGLDRVNVSLDTVRHETFRAITRRDGLDAVLAGLDAAADAGLSPVKVNAVLLRDVNEDEAGELLDFCLQRGFELRFIEAMPLDGGGEWRRDRMVAAAETLELLRRTHALAAGVRPDGSPTESYAVDGGPATVGVIASVTQPFCSDCDRVRLTADGQVRNCLFAQTETDLRTPMRAGASDDDIAALWRAAVAGKAAAHGIGDEGFRPPARGMSAIGG
ncbi:MAG: 3,8-cyclase [Frankiaceae bacterium]|nr:3,8-cyclase [Frankiaceae bacterium]